MIKYNDITDIRSIQRNCPLYTTKHTSVITKVNLKGKKPIIILSHNLFGTEIFLKYCFFGTCVTKFKTFACVKVITLKL